MNGVKDIKNKLTSFTRSYTFVSSSLATVISKSDYIAKLIVTD